MRQTTDRQAARTLRAAAEWLVREFEEGTGGLGEFSCVYILRAALGTGGEEVGAIRGAYRELYAVPAEGTDPRADAAEFAWWMQAPTRETTLARSIALLLAAEMVKTGDFFTEEYA